VCFDFVLKLCVTFVPQKVVWGGNNEYINVCPCIRGIYKCMSFVCILCVCMFVYSEGGEGPRYILISADPALYHKEWYGVVTISTYMCVHSYVAFKCVCHSCVSCVCVCLSTWRAASAKGMF